MGCMCMECKFREVITDNHKNLLSICVCRESDYFLNELSAAFDNCELGVVDDSDEEELFVDDKTREYQEAEKRLKALAERSENNAT